MGYELSVKNDNGEVLNLSRNDNYIVYKMTGLTPPKVTINSSVNTTQDGSTINSTRIENRNLVIYIAIEGDIEANRIKLYKYFPPKKTVSIYFSNDSREVYIDGTVELIECDLFSNKQVAQISIICPQPYFKAVDMLITSFSDLNPLFEFPFSIASSGVEFSTIITNVRKSIINTGDAETGIIIELFAAGGEVVNPIIYDVFKRTKMKLNFTLLQSDLIRINTNVGEKSIELIRNGVTTNAMGYMSQDSTWLQLSAGDNVFTCDTDSGGADLQITFKTTTLYSGV